MRYFMDALYIVGPKYEKDRKVWMYYYLIFTSAYSTYLWYCKCGQHIVLPQICESGDKFIFSVDCRGYVIFKNSYKT